MGFYDWDKMTPESISELYTRKVARGDNIVVARVEVMQWAVTQPHTHESEEVIIVLKGEWRFHLPSGVEHSSEALADTVALDICTPTRLDWITGEDRLLHHDPDECLWAV